MQKSDDLRKSAESYAEKAETASTLQDKARFKRMERAWKNIADSQAWLEGDREGPSPKRRE